MRSRAEHPERARSREVAAAQVGAEKAAVAQARTAQIDALKLQTVEDAAVPVDPGGGWIGTGGQGRPSGQQRGQKHRNHGSGNHDTQADHGLRIRHRTGQGNEFPVPAAGPFFGPTAPSAGAGAVPVGIAFPVPEADYFQSPVKLMARPASGGWGSSLWAAWIADRRLSISPGMDATRRLARST